MFLIYVVDDQAHNKKNSILFAICNYRFLKAYLYKFFRNKISTFVHV